MAPRSCILVEIRAQLCGVRPAKGMVEKPPRIPAGIIRANVQRVAGTQTGSRALLLFDGGLSRKWDGTRTTLQFL